MGRGPGTCVSDLLSVWLLQVEVENFVLRVAAEFSSRKEQLVFLINNYDMMLGVLMVMLPSPTGRAHARQPHQGGFSPGFWQCLRCGVRLQEVLG